MSPPSLHNVLLYHPKSPPRTSICQKKQLQMNRWRITKCMKRIPPRNVARGIAFLWLEGGDHPLGEMVWAHFAVPHNCACHRRCKWGSCEIRSAFPVKDCIPFVRITILANDWVSHKNQVDWTEKFLWWQLFAALATWWRLLFNFFLFSRCVVWRSARTGLLFICVPVPRRFCILCPKRI